MDKVLMTVIMGIIETLEKDSKVWFYTYRPVYKTYKVTVNDGVYTVYLDVEWCEEGYEQKFTTTNLEELKTWIFEVFETELGSILGL